MTDFPTIRADDLRKAVAKTHPQLEGWTLVDDLIRLAARAPYAEKAKFLKRWGK